MNKPENPEAHGKDEANERPAHSPDSRDNKPATTIPEIDLDALLADILPRHKRVEEWLERVQKLPWHDEDGDELEEIILEAFRIGKELNLSAFDPVGLKKGDRLSLHQHVALLAFKRKDAGRAEVVECVGEAIKASGIRIDVAREIPVTDLHCAYYDRNRHTFWIKSADGDFHSVTESSVKRRLAILGTSSLPEKDGSPSPADRWIDECIHLNGVDMALWVSGYKAGVIEANGYKVLVTRDTKLIEPVSGRWPTIRKWVKKMFGEQEIFVLANLQRDYLALREGRHVQGQANALIGKANCGKTLFINSVVIPVLGGTVADVYDYMTGRTPFNGDWASAVVLRVDDEVAHADMESRRGFGARIKKIVSNPRQHIHDKGLKGASLCPFWRLWLALNDEPESLRLLPPMTDNLPDKINLVYCHPDSTPKTNTISERLALEGAIKAELPAFCDWLLKWNPPRNILGGRFLVSTHHNLYIMQKLAALSPEAALLNMIDMYRFAQGSNLDGDFSSIKPWTETLAGVEVFLRKCAAHQFERICNYNGACGTYLNRLETQFPDRVKYKHTKSARYWMIYPPQDLTEDRLTAVGDGGDGV